MDVLFDAEDGAPEVRWTSGLRRPKRALARGDLEFFQNLTNPVRKEVLTPSPYEGNYLFKKVSSYFIIFFIVSHQIAGYSVIVINLEHTH